MLFRHTIYYFSGRGLPAALNFLSITLYTRLLAPEEYGRYSLVIVGVGFASTVAFQWLNLGLVRFLPAYAEDGRRPAFLSTVLAAFVALAAASAAAAAPVIAFSPDPIVRELAAFGLALLWLQALFELHLQLVRAQLSPVRYGLLATTRAAVTLGVGVALVALGLGARGALVGLGAGLAAATVIAGVRRAFGGIRPTLVDIPVLKRLALYGLPLTATALFEIVVHSSDRFLIGGLLGIDAAGRYAVAYDLTQYTLGVLMLVVSLAAYPLVVRTWELRDRAEAERRLGQNAVLLVGVGLPAAAGMALLAPNLAASVVGPDYRPAAAQLIPVLAFAVLLVKLRSFHLDLAFHLASRTGHMLLIAAVAAGANLLLNLWWIPALGPIGAAWATVAAYALATALSWALGSRACPAPAAAAAAVAPELVKIGVAVVAMAAALAPTLDLRGPVILAAQVALGAAVYGTTLWLLNVVRIRTLTLGYLAQQRSAS